MESSRHQKVSTASVAKVHIFRLLPGEDLKLEIEKFVEDENIRAGCILTCVGGLRTAVLRSADVVPQEQDTQIFTGDQENNFEITSLVGTVGLDGAHLHMSIAGKDFSVFGGHLKEGTIVYPTAEIVIGEFEGVTFTRELDPATGYNELKVGKI
jgi:hypothetical protein